MALTQVREYRAGDVKRLYNALTYAEMIAGFPTLKPGDRVRVNSSGLLYEVSEAEEVRLLSSLKSASAAQVADFQVLESEALADTDAALIRTVDGLRIHGQGLAETDSGAVWSRGLGGVIATLTTTDEIDHLVALSFGTDTESYTAAAFGPMHVEAVVTQSSAITARGMYLGFSGAMADAKDPVVSGSATTISLTDDDSVGLYFDTDLTDGDRYFLPYNNANGAASIETTAAGVDTGVDVAAAGTYQRLRVTVNADGSVEAYINGALVSRLPAASVATSVAMNPILYIQASAAAVKAMLVKEFWFSSEA